MAYLRPNELAVARFLCTGNVVDFLRPRQPTFTSAITMGNKFIQKSGIVLDNAYKAIQSLFPDSNLDLDLPQQAKLPELNLNDFSHLFPTTLPLPGSTLPLTFASNQDVEFELSNLSQNAPFQQGQPHQPNSKKILIMGVYEGFPFDAVKALLGPENVLFFAGRDDRPEDYIRQNFFENEFQRRLQKNTIRDVPVHYTIHKGPLSKEDSTFFPIKIEDNSINEIIILDIRLFVGKYEEQTSKKGLVTWPWGYNIHDKNLPARDALRCMNEIARVLKVHGSVFIPITGPGLTFSTARNDTLAAKDLKNYFDNCDVEGLHRVALFEKTTQTPSDLVKEVYSKMQITNPPEALIARKSGKVSIMVFNDR